MESFEMDKTVLSIPDESAVTGVEVTLCRPVSAIQLVKKENGVVKLGFVAQLGVGTKVFPCGKGFNDRTVKVFAQGRSYFVFRQDLSALDSTNYN